MSLNNTFIANLQTLVVPSSSIVQQQSPGSFATKL